ncbi:Elongation factor G-like protein [Azospirillaceae bacterium]
MPHSHNPSQPRCAALVGPYLSGKTSLLESLLFATGTLSRKGSAREGALVGDGAPEAKARQMSVEVSAASTEHLGERWTFLDCPGSVELSYETQCALMVADVAVVVVEPIPDKAPTVGPLLKYLDDNAIPHMVFINKMDILGETRVRDVLQALQTVSSRPLVLRQAPIREENSISGYVDLVSERAYHYNPHAPSDLIAVPATARERKQSARQELLEALADFDDGLMEQLLEDVAPDKEEVYRQLTKDLASDLIAPVFLGSAENDGGVRRLLKALRHETPEVDQTALRLDIPAESGGVAQIFKIHHAAHAGKLALVRVWRGVLADGATLVGERGDERIGGLYRMVGVQQQKLAQVGPGEVVALGRLDKIASGDMLCDKRPLPRSPLWPEPLQPVFGLAIAAENRNDDVKLSGAVQRLIEEDPSLSLEHNHDTGDMVLWGQGDIHLQIALDRLRNRYNLPVKHRSPQVPYKETIRKSTAHHSRFKRQSGGHGQFADIHIEIKPLPRGAGFQFTETVVGGSVPRQFIPAVEVGVREFLPQGTLGFPVVDIGVNLSSGQYHAVDSSEMAFKTVGRQAMVEAMPNCDPVLLEPILAVTIAVPNEFTARAQRLVSGRRGQILGFDARPGWKEWDVVNATLPQSEICDFIVELRSLTLGVGTYVWSFERLSELTGRLADKAVEQRRAFLAL